MNNDVNVRLRFIDEATSQLNSAVSKIKGAFSGVTSAAGATASKATGLIGNMVGGIKTHFDNLVAHAKWSSAIFGTVLVKALGDVVGMAAQFEKFGIAAEYLTGSAEEAKKFTVATTNMAKATMFNIDQIAEMGTRLIGNTKNVDQSMQALSALTEAVAATGGGYAELESVTRAWVQTNSKAVASSEELNRQFANANIPALRVLAESIVKNADNPLRKYISTAGSAGGATKELTKSYQSASSNLEVYKKKVDIAKMALDEYSDKENKSKVTLERKKLAVQQAEAALDKAKGTITQYTAAQATANTTVADFTVEGVMSQLQDLGDLKIPGDVMAKALTDAFNQAFGGANKALLESFSGQMSLLGDVLKTTGLAFMGLDSAWKPVKGGLLDLLKGTLKPLIEFLSNNQDNIANFATSLGRSTPFIVAMGAAILGVLLPSLIGLVAPLIQISIVAGLVGAGIGLVISQMGKWGITTDSLKTTFENLWNTANTVFTAIGSVLSSFYNQYIGPIVDAIVTKFNEVWPQVQPVFDNLVKGAVFVGGIFVNTLKPAFEALMGEIQTRVVPLFNQLKPLLANMVPILLFIGAIVGGVIVAAFTLALGIISGLIRALATFLPSIIQFVTGIVQTVTSLFQLIIGLFTGNGEMVKTAWSGLWAGILNILSGFVGATLGTVWSFIQGVIGFFKNLYTTLVGASIIPDLVNAIIDWFSNLFSGVMGFVTQLITLVIAKFVELATNVVNNVSSTVSSVIGWFIQLKDNVVAKFIELVDSVLTWGLSLKDKLVQTFNDIWTSIKGVMGNMISDAWNWGKDLIGNLIDGMKSSLGKLSGKVSSAIKDYLGLSFQHGGIVPGTAGEAVPILAHAGERVVPRNGVDASTSSSGAGNNLTINFYGGVTVDSDERVQELADRILNVLGRNSELARYGVAV